MHGIEIGQDEFYPIERFNVSDKTVAGVMAALSPQKDWFMNVSLAERVLDIYTNHQDTPWTKDMTAISQAIFGKPQYRKSLERDQAGRLG